MVVRIDGWLGAEVKKECIMHHCRCCQFEWETAPQGPNTKTTDAEATP